MRFTFKNAEAVIDGIKIVAEDIGIEIVEDAPRFTVSLNNDAENGLSVKLCGSEAEITYGGGRAKLFRALAILAKWIRDGRTEGELAEKPLFNLNGAMIDMSRNAVMNVKTVKFMLRKMALMGLNAFMLYTEDTYEVTGRDYFGYMRGRYTKEELRELDSYALKLGIELIPCIQVLGHLATHLKWSAARAYKDTASAMLVGADATYEFIEDMFKTISECFTSKRLHMGMDETHDLGTGAYLDKNGYLPRRDIYLEHLNRVTKIAQKYGFSPMMWSDMFFRISADGPVGDYDTSIVIPDEVSKLIPPGVQQVFWDYYHSDEEFYAINIEKHKKLGENTMFAGGVWTWSGHCPHYSRSLRHTPPALEACKKGGVKEVIATVWHNGADGSLVLSLPGLAWYADYDYKGCFDEKSAAECFEAACPQAKYDDFMALELPELPHGKDVCVSRALIYNDPLVPLFDKHFEGFEMQEHYKNATARIRAAVRGLDIFEPAFKLAEALSDLLENKADFGIRLKRAYDSCDRAALTALLSECDVIINKLGCLRHAHKEAWFTHNKPFGWEIFDIRYGGLIMRFETAKERISDFLSGKIKNIEELEAERLSFDGSPNAPISNRFLWLGYSSVATANRI